MADFDERDHLAISQILRSKKRATQFLKMNRGVAFDKLVAAAREYAKELKAGRREALTAKSMSPQQVSERKELLFILRNLALMGLPHKPTKEPSIHRKIRTSASTWVTITLTARGASEKIPEGERIYLPFGINARRALTMLCTIAVKTRSPIITLDSAAEFMTKLGWKPDSRGSHGGNKYDILARVLEEIQQCSLDVKIQGFMGDKRSQAESISIIRAYDLPSLTDEKLLDQGAQPLPLDPAGVKHNFKVLIDPLFFRELCGDPATGYKGSAFPLPLEFVRHFGKSTELDTAQFIVARVSGAETESRIDLHSIHEQLAFHPGNYSKFKSEFTETIASVCKVWDGCNARVDGHKLVVGPVLNGKYLVDPTKFAALPEDMFGLNNPALPDSGIN